MTQGLEAESYENWTPAAQTELANRLRSLQVRPWRPFYCPISDCNGKPHGKTPGSSQSWTHSHARKDQKPPPGAGVDWLTWAMLGGRGSGKTRSGSEYIHRLANQGPLRLAIVAPTAPDIRDVCVEGESGLLATAAPGKLPVWEPSKKLLTWPSGAQAFGFSGEEPDRLRGKQFHAAWLDEPAHMPLIEDVWDMLLLGLRLGKRPHALVTTTPLPIQWNKDLVADDNAVITRASTYENMHNLAPSFAKIILSRFEGTRKGKQEIYGEILEDVEGAMFESAWIEDNRVLDEATDPQLERIVVSIDPAGTANQRSDETGIVVVGTDGENYYVLADYSGRYSPEAWGKKAWYAFTTWQADEVVAERNYGGDMVSTILETTRPAREHAPVRTVNSRRGKVIRADPVAALYEKDKVHHMRVFDKLETQLLSWVPGKPSPDRLDAVVHGVTHLTKTVEPSTLYNPARGGMSATG